MKCGCYDKGFCENFDRASKETAKSASMCPYVLANVVYGLGC